LEEFVTDGFVKIFFLFAHTSFDINKINPEFLLGKRYCIVIAETDMA
jgi:hypothetical protein